MDQHEVYDKVWIMENNRPVQKIVFAVVESMGHFKDETEFKYHLVNDRIGAGWGNNEGRIYPPEKVFLLIHLFLDIDGPVIPATAHTCEECGVPIPEEDDLCEFCFRAWNGATVEELAAFIEEEVN